MGLTLLEIMCLRYFSRRPISFALGNQLERYHLSKFSKNFAPKREAGDMFTKIILKKTV